MRHSALKTSRNRRRGTTVVEFALAAPILLLLFLASVEFSRANVLINTSQIAASAGARSGIIMGTTAADIEATVRQELNAVGVREAEVMVDPLVVTDETKLVTVGVSVPLDERNGYVTPKYFLGDHVFKITAIPREAKNDPNMTTLMNSSLNSMKDKLKNPKGNPKQEPATGNDDG